jgi:hypothetical protein
MIKRTPVGKDSFEIEGDGRYGLHYGPKDAARIGAHFADALSKMPHQEVEVQSVADAVCRKLVDAMNEGRSLSMQTAWFRHAGNDFAIRVNLDVVTRS